MCFITYTILSLISLINNANQKMKHKGRVEFVVYLSFSCLFLSMFYFLFLGIVLIFTFHKLKFQKGFHSAFSVERSKS